VGFAHQSWYASGMDIYKADSKGRLGGFEAGRSYWVDRGDNVIRVEPVVRQHQIKTPLNEQGSDYLDSFGLDKHRVSSAGHDAEGYWQFELDSEGRKMLDQPGGRGEVIQTWTSWPEGFDYDEFKRLSWL
jgi:hypothetical protein